MAVCPECGRALHGAPRRCGYCGASLVSDYFSRPQPPARRPAPSLGAGFGAVATLGVFGSLAVLAALVLRLLALFNTQDPAWQAGLSMRPGWWVQLVLMAALPTVYLVQTAVLQSKRFSRVFDCVWLLLASCGLSFVLQAYFDRGAAAFDGVVAVAYLLTVGCALLAVASITAILCLRDGSAA